MSSGRYATSEWTSCEFFMMEQHSKIINVQRKQDQNTPDEIKWILSFIPICAAQSS